MFERWFALDPGSDSLRIHDYTKENDVILRACYGLKDKKPELFGKEALEYTYKDHRTYQVRYPFQRNLPVNHAKPLLEHALQEIGAYDYVFKPSFLIPIYPETTEAEKDQWRALLVDLGAKKVEFVAASDFLQVDNPCFSIHAGHSCSMASIMADNHTLAFIQIPFGGMSMDDLIQKKIARSQKVLISAEDAKALREETSRLLSMKKNGVMQCTGLNQHHAFQSIEIASNRLWPYMRETEEQIARYAKSIYDPLSLELKEALMENGIYLSGGLANCFGLSQILHQTFNCRIHISKAPDLELFEHMKGWK